MGRYIGKKVKVINIDGHDFIEGLEEAVFDTYSPYLEKTGTILTYENEAYITIIFDDTSTEALNKEYKRIGFRLENLMFIGKIAPQTKYKVGDKVRVRIDLEAGRQYNNSTFAGAMAKYKGQAIIITYVTKDYSYIAMGFCWTEDMLEPYIENLVPDEKFSPFMAEFGCKAPDNHKEYDIYFRYLTYLRINDRI